MGKAIIDQDNSTHNVTSIFSQHRLQRRKESVYDYRTMHVSETTLHPFQGCKIHLYQISR